MPFEITESWIREHASSESFRRGEDYYRQGTVLSLTRRGGVLRAEVAGSEFAPYEVRVAFDEAGITEAACSCPYEWGGWCKHIVAALLACIHEPESVRERPALEEVLSELDREQLQTILLRLAERDPSLAEVVESEVSFPASPDARSVNTDAIRRRIRSSIHRPGYIDPYEDHWRGGGDLDEARRVLDGAWSIIRAGDSRGALPVLEAITDEYIEAQEAFGYWEMMGDYGGELLDFFGEVGAAWTEALLSVDDLTPREREDYGAKLDVWWGELRDYDAGDAFGTAFRAIEQGWSYPPLVKVLEGEASDEEVFERYDPLIVARLNVLERQRRHEEYLHLSEAAGESTGHAVMLARLGRAQEAVEYGLKRLNTPDEALAVAGTLREQGELEQALRIGEHGLSLDGRKGALAVWLRDLAGGMGRTQLASKAAVVAFHADPDLASYRRVRELVGERWPEHRAQLLDYLRRSAPYYPWGYVEVFLHEDLIQDAIDAVEESPIGALLEQVTDAAIESKPDWVIKTCRAQAEEIMDSGRSKHYEEAVRWLAKARDTYLADGREEEWQAYLGELIYRHQRKYKLRPMLEDLGKR